MDNIHRAMVGMNQSLNNNFQLCAREHSNPYLWESYPACLIIFSFQHTIWIDFTYKTLFWLL